MKREPHPGGGRVGARASRVLPARRFFGGLSFGLLGVGLLGIAAVAAAFGRERLAEKRPGAGIGFDTGRRELFLSLGLNRFAKLEAGAGMAEPDSGGGLDFTAAGNVLVALHAYPYLTGYLALGLAGGNVERAGRRGPGAEREAQVALFLGYEPEIVLFGHLGLSTRFGFGFPLSPKPGIRIEGPPEDVWSGLKLKMLF